MLCKLNILAENKGLFESLQPLPRSMSGSDSFERLSSWMSLTTESLTFRVCLRGNSEILRLPVSLHFPLHESRRRSQPQSKHGPHLRLVSESPPKNDPARLITEIQSSPFRGLNSSNPWVLIPSKKVGALDAKHSYEPKKSWPNPW